MSHTADFSPINQTLIFSTGGTTGDEQCGFVTITDDSTVENNETFLVFFTTNDPVVDFLSSQPQQSVVTIIDDDGKY